MMPEVYKYICGCGHWWMSGLVSDLCPRCGKSDMFSRVYQDRDVGKMVERSMELVNARQLIATMERDHMMTVEEKITALAERDDARRWAVHFYRLWKATQHSTVSGYYMLDISPWKSGLDTMAERMRANGIEPAGIYRFDHETGKDVIIEPVTVNVTGLDHLQQAIEDAKPAIDEAMREAAQRTAERVTGKPTVASKGRKAKEAK